MEEVQVRGIKNNNEDVYVVAKELHGRKQIFTNETQITRKNVIEVLNKALPKHLSNRADEVYLEKFVRGIQPILDRVKQYNDYVCNRTVVNIANEIVAFKTSSFAGQPIQYVSRGAKDSVPPLVEKLNSMMISEEKQSKDMQLAFKMFTDGVAYRLVLNDKSKPYADGELSDEAPFEIYIPDPRNTFVVRANDVTKKVVMGVTYVYLDDTNVRYTVYTDNVTYTIVGNAQRAGKITGEVVHNFGMVTLIEYPCNTLYMSPIEVVHDLLCAYSLVTSDRLDGVEQFIQALMVFEGVDITREQFLELRDLGAIKLPPAMDGRQSRVYYLSEQLDQAQTQTLVDDIYQTILRIVGMPSQGSGNTGDSSNNGAVILKNGWWSAEARDLETAGMWRQAETEFLKVVLKICEEANAISGLKVSDIQPKFGSRSYEDKLTKTQSFTTLIDSGCPPIQAFTVSGMMNDPEAAAIQYEAYREEQEAKADEKLSKELDEERKRINESVQESRRSDSEAQESGAETGE